MTQFQTIWGYFLEIVPGSGALERVRAWPNSAGQAPPETAHSRPGETKPSPGWLSPHSGTQSGRWAWANGGARWGARGSRCPREGGRGRSGPVRPSRKTQAETHPPAPPPAPLRPAPEAHSLRRGPSLPQSRPHGPSSRPLPVQLLGPRPGPLRSRLPPEGAGPAGRPMAGGGGARDEARPAPEAGGPPRRAVGVAAPGRGRGRPRRVPSRSSGVEWSRRVGSSRAGPDSLPGSPSARCWHPAPRAPRHVPFASRPERSCRRRG